jgi:phospholipid transport system substrate-binding protein
MNSPVTRLPLLAALFAMLLAFPAAAAETKEAKQAPLSPPAQFVQKLGDTALMSLTSKNLDRKTREARVRNILRGNFDIQAIGKFSMGPYWREATPAQRSEYMNLFEDMIVKTYTTRFEDYSGQTLKVSGSTSAGKDHIVTSQIVQTDGPPVNLEWRVRGMRVVDVVVEGVSMSVTQRSDFASVIQSGGGKIEALLSSLRERKNGPPQKKI